MSTFDRTAPSQTETIAFEFDLRHAPEKVWRALTEPALLAEWLLPVIDLELVPGKEFTYKTQPYPGWDGIVNCRMLEVDPPRRISYTWTVPFLETVVTFTLQPTDGGTLLKLVQTGFKEEQKREFGGARYGWNMMGGKLVELLEKTV
ncbi:MAG TPA: SRPBCC domain-containing protein [Gemmatimonas sp.]|uniref:SRPBCC family protein n=1 Tax=Gemmatimonas sp. TaxID=1962908 RepID=UPI002EDB407F